MNKPRVRHWKNLAEVDKLDLSALADRLRRHVVALAQSPRAPGTSAHQRAAEYIRNQLCQAGFDVSQAPFSEAGFTGVNLMTTAKPDCDDLPLLILGAHYDSGLQTPGADDNASGLAALLELADAVRFHTQGVPHCRVQLVAYDLEESGMIGSYVHARQLQSSKTALRGMISLEMLGFTAPEQRLPPHLASFYPNIGNFIGIVGNENSQRLLTAFTAAMKSIAGLPVEFIALPGNGEAIYEARLSDHSPFWDRGFPALMITDTSFFRNPHYHQPSDTPETLDYPFLAKVTAGVCRAVEVLWHAA
jgi:hypothetical protein